MDGTRTFTRMRQLLREIEGEADRLESKGSLQTAGAIAPVLAQVLELASAFVGPSAVSESLDRAMLAFLRLVDAQRAFVTMPGIERDVYARVEEELVIGTRRRVERASRVLAGRVPPVGAVYVALPASDDELTAAAEQKLGPVACVVLEVDGARASFYFERDPGLAPFTVQELASAELLGRFIAQALPAAKLAQEQRESKFQLDLLNRLYESLSQSLELDQVLDMIAQVTLEVTDAERAFILLTAGTQLYFGAARDTQGPLPQQSTRDISRSVCRKVIDGGEGVYIYDMAHDPEYAQARSVVALQINSVVAVPLRSQAGLTGVLYIDSRAKLMTSLEQKLAVLTTVSHVASLAVESAKLYRQATIDSLTGMYVRSFFMLRLEEELRRSARYGRTFSLLVMDVDRFKSVNDTYGHQIGDDVLQAVSEAIKRSIRGGVDMPGRYGGDELVLLLPETSQEGARIVAERIRGMVAGSPVAVPGGGSINATLSIGVASFPMAGDSTSQLFAHADQALYAAKQAGRNCFREYQP